MSNKIDRKVYLDGFKNNAVSRKRADDAHSTWQMLELFHCPMSYATKDNGVHQKSMYLFMLILHTNNSTYMP